PTIATAAAPSTSAVSANLKPVTEPRQCARRVAAYTITEQNTPPTPASAAAIPSPDRSRPTGNGAKYDAANAADSPANAENTMISRLSHDVRTPRKARNAYWGR